MTHEQIIENAEGLAVVLEKHNFVITPEGGAPVQLAKIVRACIEGAKNENWGEGFCCGSLVDDDFFLTALTPQTPE